MTRILIPVIILVLIWFLIVKNKKLQTNQKIPTQSQTRIFFIILIFLSTINLVQEVTLLFESHRIEIHVKEKNFASQFFKKDSVRPLIKHFPQAEVRGVPAILSDDGGFELNLINAFASKKNNILDSVMFLIITIICAIGLWKLDLKLPFAGSLSKTTFKISSILLIFWGLEFAKNYLIDISINKKTNGEYKFENLIYSFNSINLWLGAIFFRLSQIIRTGEQLQKEQDLTV